MFLAITVIVVVKLHVIKITITNQSMAMTSHQKAFLPEKLCSVCKRPFRWRKKWQRCWNEVNYCSERCRRQRGKV